jgi:hypothetical protein
MPEPYRQVSALPTGTAFSRYLMCLGAAKGDMYTELMLAERFKDSPQVHAAIELRTKGAVFSRVARRRDYVGRGQKHQGESRPDAGTKRGDGGAVGACHHEAAARVPHDSPGPRRDRAMIILTTRATFVQLAAIAVASLAVGSLARILALIVLGW